jgi:endonuclease III
LSKKTSTSPASLLGKVQPRFASPARIEGFDLMEHGLAYVLMRHLTGTQAEQTVRAFKAAYADWNEPRVAQVQELVQHIKTKSREAERKAARTLKDYLQDVFQKNHGFDLEFLHEGSLDSVKFLGELVVLGAAGGHYLLWLAQKSEEPPVTHALVRVLDRLGLMARTQSLKKAAALADKARGNVDALAFSGGFGVVIDNWCTPRAPLCHECPLRADCPYGQKAYKEWLAQQKRLEDQRNREEAREAARLKKEEGRRQREEERERKHREAEEKRLARERERAERAAAKEREKAERAAARSAAQAAKSKKKQTVKPAAKKSTAKKGGAKKSTAKQGAAKKAPAKKTAAKKPAPKKAASKKRPAAKGGAGKRRSAKSTSGGAKRTKTKKAASRPSPRRRRA